MPKIPIEILTPEIMLLELEANRLEVVLIAATERKHSGHKVRAVQTVNCLWYREFCALYRSNRKGHKWRSRIKRFATIRALKKLIAGVDAGMYGDRLESFIEFHTKQAKQIKPIGDYSPIFISGKKMGSF